MSSDNHELPVDSSPQATFQLPAVLLNAAPSGVTSQLFDAMEDDLREPTDSSPSKKSHKDGPSSNYLRLKKSAQDATFQVQQLETQNSEQLATINAMRTEGTALQENVEHLQRKELEQAQILQNQETELATLRDQRVELERLHQQQAEQQQTELATLRQQQAEVATFRQQQAELETLRRQQAEFATLRQQQAELVQQQEKFQTQLKLMEQRGDGQSDDMKVDADPSADHFGHTTGQPSADQNLPTGMVSDPSIVDSNGVFPAAPSSSNASNDSSAPQMPTADASHVPQSGHIQNTNPSIPSVPEMTATPPQPSAGSPRFSAPQQIHSVFNPPPGVVNKPIQELSPFTGGGFNAEDIANRWASRRKPARSRNLKTPSRISSLVSPDVADLLSSATEETKTSAPPELHSANGPISSHLPQLPPLPGLDHAQQDMLAAFMASMHGSLQSCVASTISAILPNVVPVALQAQCAERAQDATGRGTTAQRKKASRNTRQMTLLQEKTTDSPAIRCQFLDYTRQLFKRYLVVEVGDTERYTVDAQARYFVPPNARTVQAFEDGEGPGPVLSSNAENGEELPSLHIEWHRNADTKWNKAARKLLADKLRDTLTPLKDVHGRPLLPSHSDSFFLDLVDNRYTKLKAQCSSTKARPLPTGEWETEDDVNRRLDSQDALSKVREKHRQRRNYKYQRRRFIATEKINLCSESKLVQDQKIWTWFRDVLDRLAADGMSSEDSPDEAHPGLWRVRVMFWRKDIGRYLDIIDNAPKEDPRILDPRGAKAFLRRRGPVSEGFEETRRGALMQLPRSFYNEDWLDGDERRSIMLEVTREEFKWIQIHQTSRP